MNNFCSENQFLLPTTPFQVFSEFVLWLFDFPFNRPSLSFYPFHIFVMYKRHGHVIMTLEHFLKIASAVKLLSYLDNSRGFPGSLVRDGARFFNFSFLSSSSPYFIIILTKLLLLNSHRLLLLSPLQLRLKKDISMNIHGNIWMYQINILQLRL